MPDGSPGRMMSRARHHEVLGAFFLNHPPIRKFRVDVRDPDHPLTTRVIVNRIWQYHFGTGLAATADDLGTLGEPPSHPDLLDWLTKRFLEDGWSIKSLHRRIMNSAVYRQTSLRPAPPSSWCNGSPDRLPARSRASHQRRIRCSGSMNGSSVSRNVPQCIGTR